MSDDDSARGRRSKTAASIKQMRRIFDASDSGGGLDNEYTQLARGIPKEQREPFLQAIHNDQAISGPGANNLSKLRELLNPYPRFGVLRNDREDWALNDRATAMSMSGRHDKANDVSIRPIPAYTGEYQQTPDPSIVVRGGVPPPPGTRAWVSEFPDIAEAHMWHGLRRAKTETDHNQLGLRVYDLKDHAPEKMGPRTPHIDEDPARIPPERLQNLVQNPIGRGGIDRSFGWERVVQDLPKPKEVYKKLPSYASRFMRVRGEGPALLPRMMNKRAEERPMRAYHYDAGARDALEKFGAMAKIAVGMRQAKRIEEAARKYWKIGLRGADKLTPEQLKNIDGQAGVAKLLTHLAGKGLPDISAEGIQRGSQKGLLSLEPYSTGMRPNLLQEIRSKVQRTAMSGRHGQTPPEQISPPPRNATEDQAAKYLNEYRGTRPAELAYRGGSAEQAAAHSPETPRWLSGSPAVASGYGDTITAHRLPEGVGGPYTQHVAKDTREMNSAALQNLPMFKRLTTSAQGAWPFYEKVVPHGALAPSLVARYKKLPMSEDQYQQVQGKENPLALPPKLTQ